MQIGQKLPFKISVLCYIKNAKGEFLMIERNNMPNKGLLSPIGGKLEMATGESPHECAKREIFEETGFAVEISDLHLFGMVSERAYEGDTNWLMFLFDCKKVMDYLPKAMDEGSFKFMALDEIKKGKIPESDKKFIWDLYEKHKDGFAAMKIDCSETMTGKYCEIL